jgi:hypothetical protein
MGYRSQGAVKQFSGSWFDKLTMTKKVHGCVIPSLSRDAKNRSRKDALTDPCKTVSRCCFDEMNETNEIDGTDEIDGIDQKDQTDEFYV